MSAKALKVDGDPGRIRTCDPRFRKPVLYPAELRSHASGLMPARAACRQPAPMLVLGAFAGELCLSGT